MFRASRTARRVALAPRHRRSTGHGRGADQACSALGDVELRMVAELALRDDYDPVVFLFCLNAIFISVVVNVLNFGLDKDENGQIKMPEGGFDEVIERQGSATGSVCSTPYNLVCIVRRVQHNGNTMALCT